MSADHEPQEIQVLFLDEQVKAQLQKLKTVRNVFITQKVYLSNSLFKNKIMKWNETK